MAVKLKRLIIEMSAEEHQRIKLNAMLKGVSIKKYVLDRLNREYSDIDDLNEPIKSALNEVAQYKNGKIKLTTFDDFMAEVKA